VGDEIVQFINDDKNWTIVVSRLISENPVPLQSVKEARAPERIGLMEMTETRFKNMAPGVEVLRKDVSNAGDAEMGMLAFRYTQGTQRKLTQQAIIQADDRTQKMYYLVSFTSPGAKLDMKPGEEDPGEREAAEMFTAVLDSVKLLDLSAVKQDLDERLIRTRALFINLGMRMKATMVLRSGKPLSVFFFTVISEPFRRSSLQPSWRASAGSSSWRPRAPVPQRPAPANASRRPRRPSPWRRRRCALGCRWR
jgi:hypothetical protein